MRGNGWRAWPLAFLGLWGCQTQNFSCADDQACEGVGPAALCELNGYCSFADADCDSGRRYGDLAGDGLGGQCVDWSMGTGGTGPSTAQTATGTQGTLDDGSTAGMEGSSGGEVDDGTFPPPADWWDCDWTARRRLTLQGPSVGQTLTGVPLLVVVNDTRIDPSLMADDGHDIRFVTDDGISLPFEIEQWTPEGLSWIWVRLPEFPLASSTLYMYYGNPGAPPTGDGTTVWSGYQGVWHMGAGLPDATQLSEVISAEAVTRPGQVAAAQLFAEPTDGAQVAAVEPGSIFAAGGTLTAMVRASGYGSQGQGPILGRSLNLEGDGGWVFQLDEGRAALRFSRDFGMGRGNWFSPNGSISLFTWHHVAVAYEDTSELTVPVLFIDGVEQSLDTVGNHGGSASPIASDTLDIGGIPGSIDQWFDGVIDEVRLAPVPRSADWMAVQAASLRDGVVVYGPQQRCTDN